MKPLRVKPLPASYDPGYPRFVEIEDWERLIASSDRETFRPSTLLFVGILGSSLLVSETNAETRQAKLGPPLNSPNSKAAEIANDALKEAKGGFWYEHSTCSTEEIVKGNPPVTIPHIRISFGNSYVGVFDTVQAKKVTLKLFEAYGLKLKSEYHFQKDGVLFDVDGYDPAKQIGFEIVGSDNPRRGFGKEEPRQETDPKKVLDENEAKTLNSMISEGKETMLLVPAEKFPNMDGDEYTPLRAYLQSVLDYLEWLKQQGKL